MKLTLEDFSVGGTGDFFPSDRFQPSRPVCNQGGFNQRLKLPSSEKRGSLGAPGVEKHGYVADMQYGAAW